MGQRQRTRIDTPQPYRYPSKEACEEAEDFHLFKPSVWPPRRTANQIEEPSVSGRCQNCGCWLTVYEGHAKGEMPGIKVVLPN